MIPQFASGDSFPKVIQLAPARYAVHIRKYLDAWQGSEFRPGKPFDLIYQRNREDCEIPGRGVEWWNVPDMQHGPLACQHLPWRKACATFGIRADDGFIHEDVPLIL